MLDDEKDDYLFSIIGPCLCPTKHLTLSSHVSNRQNKYVLTRHFEYRYFGVRDSKKVNAIRHVTHCIECMSFDYFD
jgi:hypothetical protein